MNTTEAYRARLQDEERAREYATRFERGPRRRINLREQRAVRRIFSDLPGCEVILDVPCGAGRFLPALTGSGREVIEMDQAAEVLEFAKQRAHALAARARFVQGDAAKTGLPDAGVDAVFCNRLLHHITSAPERAVFLREFHRVTRRHLVVSFFDYQAFGEIRLLLKKLKGRKVNYAGQPTLKEFTEETKRCGFNLIDIVRTGAFWVAQKYFVLEKAPV